MDELNPGQEWYWVYNSFTARNYPVLGHDEAVKIADAIQRKNNIHAKAVRVIASVIVSHNSVPIYYTIPERY